MSKYGIIKLMYPWAGLADVDDVADRYMELGELTEENYRQIIKQDLVPYYCSLPKKKRLELLNKLKIALEDKKCNFEREFHSVLPPFDPSEAPKQFFVWIYEELQASGDA